MTRTDAAGSRAHGTGAKLRRSDGVRTRKRTVPMVGVKYTEARHGDLRARLRAAVEGDGEVSAADWLTRLLDRRDAEVSAHLRQSVHPLAAVAGS